MTPQAVATARALRPPSEPPIPPEWGAPSPDLVRAALIRAWGLLQVGPPEPGSIGGQLLRPLFGAAAITAFLPEEDPPGRKKAAGSEGAGGGRGESTKEAEEGEVDRRSPVISDRVALALLAVQLAHEASLLHDDVVDQAATRRNRPTLCATRGIGAALIMGDHLLSRAYLAAAMTGSPVFTERFARAVERTIAGERAQGELRGARIDEARSRDLARAKSGELFGCALSAAATIEGSPRAEELADLGREIGLAYQRMDDLLDFCPSAGTGKPPLADASQGLWTWPLNFLQEGESHEGLFQQDEEGSLPILRALEALEAEGDALHRRVRRALPHATPVHGTLRRWMEGARQGIAQELRVRGIPKPAGGTRRDPEAPAGSAAPHLLLEDKLPLPEEAGLPPALVLERHGRSFHFASRLMPKEVRTRIARVYAFCRIVDDAVDREPDPTRALAVLETLRARARREYEGENGALGGEIGIAMQEMREAGIPFQVADELFEGVRMDLAPREFATLTELRVYTHRVAGVVGLWMAGLAGVRDPWALRQAAELGHAMQLTNIVRDVGADLALGRVYLPTELLERHGLSREFLLTIQGGSAPTPPAYASALEEMMGWADASYGAAFQAIPHLPSGFRRAVAVASRVYQGIHGEVRRRGHDTLRNRASTGTLRKGLLALGALRDLGRIPT